MEFIMKPFVFITFVCVLELSLQMGSCFQFQAANRAGWAVPPANQTDLYNEWASRERFEVGDTVRFKYKKDSVMEVNKTEYNECNSSRPNFFSNKGDTIYTLDRSGFFYFISGATGHCERGQRMIVWVIGQDEDSTAKSHAYKNNALFSYALFLIVSVFHFFA
ncbi:LOW QUALITY PROTEIN: early nodulin-like protein 21 [Primulina tabacum]|uniref:LOW QUALITY PROTEIN: early nodulin-like protein 21 n=1 Tax=Primulina tabacum TaxID=48773 RepID=UPI003F5A2FD5